MCRLINNIDHFLKYIASPWKRTIIASGGALLGIIPPPKKKTQCWMNWQTYSNTVILGFKFTIISPFFLRGPNTWVHYVDLQPYWSCKSQGQLCIKALQGSIWISIMVCVGKKLKCPRNITCLQALLAWETVAGGKAGAFFTAFPIWIRPLQGFNIELTPGFHDSS